MLADVVASGFTCRKDQDIFQFGEFIPAALDLPTWDQLIKIAAIRHVSERVHGDQHDRVRLLQHIAQFITFVQKIDWNCNGAHHGNGKFDGDEFRKISHQQRHVVSRLHTKVTQASSQLCRPCMHLGIGPTLTIRQHKNPVGVILGVLCKQAIQSER